MNTSNPHRPHRQGAAPKRNTSSRAWRPSATMVLLATLLLVNFALKMFA